MTQECIFCTERIFKAGETPVALCCGHVFHERCIRTWFTSKKHCPTCKQNRQQALAKTTDGVIKLFLDCVPGMRSIELEGRRNRVPGRFILPYQI